jgi:hypothetical protein
MFDVQALRAPRGAALPEPVLASIARDNPRGTTDANPMGRLVGLVMIAAIAAAIVHLFDGSAPLPRRIALLVLLVAPALLAGARVLPNARRLGARADDAETQSRLARAIARDHVACFGSIVALVVLRLAVL